jgi:hypothetical protein
MQTLGTYEARTFRNSLNGGLYGDGRIFVDGVEIPLMEYEWGLLGSDGLADAYILTGSVGSVKLISGQYNDLRKAVAMYPEAGYGYTDGGRLMTWSEWEKVCIYREVEMQPRILMWAPWAQCRIEDINCNMLGGLMSPDPFSTHFMGTSFSFSTAFCETDEIPGVLRPGD